MSLMSSSLPRQQCPACPVCLTWIILLIGGMWQYRCCFVGYCLQDLFNIACSILMQLHSSFYSIRLVRLHAVHPNSSIDMTLLGKKRVLFYRSGLTSMWPIVYRHLSMPLLVACWCLSQLMRNCVRGRWTCPLGSQNYHLVVRCRLLHYNTCIPSCLRCHGVLCQQLLVPDHAAGNRTKLVYLPEVQCHRCNPWA